MKGKYTLRALEQRELPSDEEKKKKRGHRSDANHNSNPKNRTPHSFRSQSGI